MPAVGTNVPRKDSTEKVTGTARYVEHTELTDTSDVDDPAWAHS